MTGSDLLNPPRPAGQSWRDRPKPSDDDIAAVAKDTKAALAMLGGTA